MINPIQYGFKTDDLFNRNSLELPNIALINFLWLINLNSNLHLPFDNDSAYENKKEFPIEKLLILKNEDQISFGFTEKRLRLQRDTKKAYDNHIQNQNNKSIKTRELRKTKILKNHHLNQPCKKF